MMEWTKSAQDELNRYLADARTRASASGAEPDEVAQDMRRHVDEELTGLKLVVVTAEDVRRVITRMDRPDDPPQESKPQPNRSRRQRWAEGALVFFGVVLPLAALITELFTSMCSEMFFDPIPTVGHALLIALVPIANLLTWLGVKRNWKTWLAVLGGLNGAALVVSLYYTFVFLPIMPMAAFFLIGVIVGIGLLALLPMSPLFSFIAGIKHRRRLQTAFLGQPRGRVAGTRWGGRTRLDCADLPDDTRIANQARTCSGIVRFGSVEQSGHPIVARDRAQGRPVTLLLPASVGAGGYHLDDFVHHGSSFDRQDTRDLLPGDRRRV